MINDRLAKLGSQRLEDLFFEQKAARLKEVHQFRVCMFDEPGEAQSLQTDHLSSTLND